MDEKIPPVEQGPERRKLRVRHKKYGWGTVEELRGGGSSWVVVFDKEEAPHHGSAVCLPNDGRFKEVWWGEERSKQGERMR